MGSKELQQCCLLSNYVVSVCCSELFSIQIIPDQNWSNCLFRTWFLNESSSYKWIYQLNTTCSRYEILINNMKPISKIKVYCLVRFPKRSISDRNILLIYLRFLEPIRGFYRAYLPTKKTTVHTKEIVGQY